ncbi:MAG: PKD domain-containing protein, partial [Bacteroidia bacterium]|nr:PKD domain-containing protein [Bacteroidia bacterium]
DTAWINIEIKTSGAPAYDTRATALDAGMISGTANINLSVGCLSLGNTEEYLTTFGSDYKDYSQTAWVVFKSDNYTEVLNFSLQLNGIASKGKDSLLWGYRIYLGNAAVNPAGLACIDSAVSFVPNFSLSRQVDSICHISSYSYYSVQFIFHKEDEYQLMMNIYESGLANSIAPFPGNIPSSHNLGVLKNKVSTTSYDHFACNGLMPYNMCGTVAPAFIHDSIFQTRWLPGGVLDKYLARVDTFDLATWLTFILPAEGLLNIDARWVNYVIKKIKLFEGDVNLNCNIPLISEREGIDADLCLKAGTYSLQLLGKSFKDRPSSIGNTQLGYKTTTRILFTQAAVQNPGVYDTITNPDDLGDITASINSGGKTTQTYYVGGATDTAIIARDTIAGRFTFVQFHLSQPLTIMVECKVYSPFRFTTSHRLLRGKTTQIFDTSALIPSAYGQFGPSLSGNVIKSSCLNLDTGWYTIVGYHNLQPCETNTIGFSFKISRITYTSTPKYNAPGIALKINNGMPLDWAPNTGTATYPKTRAVYTIGTHYFGCETDTPMPVKLKCPVNVVKAPMVYVNYYVFEIKNSQTFLKIRTTQSEPDRYDYHIQDYVLLRGDVSKDSTILNDSTRIVSSCESYVSYCNLNSGIYTLVKFKKNAGNVPISDMFYLDIDKRYESAFDYVSNANEIGLIPPDNTEKRSRPDFISCLTGADINNPEMGSYIIQPKDTPDFSHADNIQKNVWYTFQVSGTGLVNVKGYLYNYPNAYSPYRLYVYQSDDSSGLPFKQTVDSNFVDSTKQQGLKLIGQSQSNETTGGPPSLQFQKLGCATTRYYAMVVNENQYSDMFQVELGIKFKGVNYPQAGDLCSTAIQMVATAPSTISAIALVNCHSIGESFGEDGSNLGCLGDKRNIKTTWFKYTYSGSEKVDLIFSINNLSNAPSALVHYRVLYGGCNSMTSGPCVDNANSSFKLDCMGAGDYYIQVSTPLETTGNIQLSAIALKTTYPVCKPFDLFMPFANFVADGGCKGSTVSFINYSTQGNNIIYRWDFGNGITSTAKTPSITFIQKYLTDTFNVKLMVTDTALGKSDSIIIPVFIFYNQITLDAGNDTIVKCNYTNIQLHAATGYATPVFEWNPAGKFDNPYSQNPKVLQAENIMLQLKMTAENCVLLDSLKMTVIAEDNIIGDSLLSCSSGPAILKVPAGYTNYLWSTGQTGSSIQVIKPDKYSVRMQKGSCVVYDTIEVTGKEPVLF